VIAESYPESRWIGQIDGVVAAVFHLMLGRSCGEADEEVAAGMKVSAKVLFSGAVEGCCVVEFTAAAARKLTDAFLGAEGGSGIAWDDAMVDDAVGELCNMIAGGWKSQLGNRDAACHLSSPTIERGMGLVEMSGCGGIRVERTYGFDGSVFRVELAIRQGQLLAFSSWLG
jgi:chemotaxis protein CheX